MAALGRDAPRAAGAPDTAPHAADIAPQGPEATHAPKRTPLPERATASALAPVEAPAGPEEAAARAEAAAVFYAPGDPEGVSWRAVFARIRARR